GTKKDDPCAIQESSSVGRLTLFFQVSLTRGPVHLYDDLLFFFIFRPVPYLNDIALEEAPLPK
ncbi:hypothetical protein, partial [Paenibacillus sp. CGMCC 1.18879]|uniref:hypothetical protein n=1 Tax=Paenibacillus sp. CGMCC 1.18879 TaxID=2834466 RepID=UPI001CA846C1